MWKLVHNCEGVEFCELILSKPSKIVVKNAHTVSKISVCLLAFSTFSFFLKCSNLAKILDGEGGPLSNRNNISPCYYRWSLSLSQHRYKLLLPVLDLFVSIWWHGLLTVLCLPFVLIGNRNSILFCLIDSFSWGWLDITALWATP